MSVKKYRWCLVMLTLVLVIVGVLSYLYYSKQDNSYRDGTLVLNEYVLEEELA